MKRKRLWAGIDLGSETASVCVIDESGEVVHEGTCASRAKDVRHELTTFRRGRFAGVGIEAGCGAHVSRGLRNFGYPVELFEARQLSKFLRARRNKTDAGDAHGIAEAGRIGASNVSRVYLKSIDSQALLSCLSIRRHLIRQRVAASTMLARQLEHFGGHLRCNMLSNQFPLLADREIKKLFGNGPSLLVDQMSYLVGHSERLISYQRRIDRELIHAARSNEVCRRLMEIPGVGPLCALHFCAAVDDPNRFARAASVGSYFGLAPRLHQSGTTTRKTRISKMGNKTVRSLLVHAAGLHLRYCNPDSALRHWTLAIERRRGRAPSRIALARKLSIIMLTMWKDRTHFDPPLMVGARTELVQALSVEDP